MNAGDQEVGEARSSDEIPVIGMERRGLGRNEADSKRTGADWMSDQPTTAKTAAELTLREAMLAPKLRDWRAKLSAKAKQEKRYHQL